MGLKSQAYWRAHPLTGTVPDLPRVPAALLVQRALHSLFFLLPWQKYPDRKQLRKEKVCLGPRLQRDQVIKRRRHDISQERPRGQKLPARTAFRHQRGWSQEGGGGQKVGRAVSPQSPPPGTCFLQQGSSSALSDSIKELIGTKCSNTWACWGRFSLYWIITHRSTFLKTGKCNEIRSSA